MLGRQLTRRAALQTIGGGVLGSLLLSACGGSSSETTETAESTPTPTTAAASGGSSSTPTAAASPTPSTQGTTGGTPATGDPVRVGVIATLSGVYTSLGENMIGGIQVALDEVGGVAGGRPIELVIEDSAGSPDQALAKARQLIERDKVHLLAGVILSNEAAALRDFVVEQQIPWIIGNAGLPGLTRDPNMRSPYIFRVSCANGQYEAPFGQYAYEKLGYRRIVLTALDYSAGHDKAGAFGKRFQEAGGEIVGEVYAPIDTQDYGPYLQRIQQMDADAVFAFYSGGDAARFVPQYVDFGLADMFPLIGSGDTVDENILAEQGEAALGVVSVLHYSPLYDSPENQKFVEEFNARYNAPTGQFSYQGYLNGRVIVEALNATDGNVEDTESFLQALREVQFVGPAGEFRFHPESQGPVIPVFVRRVEELPDGTLGNVVIDELGAVDDLSY
ncbi:MAG: ABC transporter substrate-binding protein [Sphaerobacter sp.]|nr:ABC transporter substrate-binding protein [Sphaerobacter sp.]